MAIMHTGKELFYQTVKPFISWGRFQELKNELLIKHLARKVFADEVFNKVKVEIDLEFPDDML